MTKKYYLFPVAFMYSGCTDYGVKHGYLCFGQNPISRNSKKFVCEKQNHESGHNMEESIGGKRVRAISL